MGGKSGTKVQVTEYYMSQHFGVCTVADAVKKIIIKEKVAWSGYVTEQSWIRIQQDDLFGGATKEGGATGTIYFLMGRADQVLYDELATRLGRANGADAPGYRGLTSLFFTGRPDVNKGAKGFYWTANNPYLPGVWATVERAPVGLDPAYAMIPRPGTEFQFEQKNDTFTSSTASRLVLSPDGKWLIRWVNNDVEWWDTATRTNLGFNSNASGNPYILVGTIINMAVANDGTVYFMGTTTETGTPKYLFVCPPLGTPSQVLSDATSGFNGPTRVFDLLEGRKVFSAAGQGGYLDYGQHVAGTSDASYDFCDGGDGVSVYAISQPTGASSLFTITDLTGPNGSHVFTTGLSPRGGPTTARIFYSTTFEHFMVVTDGHYFIIPKATWTISASGVSPFGTGMNLFPLDANARTFWVDYSEYSLDDASLVRTVDPHDWVVENSDGGKAFVDNAIWTGADGVTRLTIRDLGVELDANPANIIYECLTNTDWGMGSPTALIDTANFNEVAVVLYDEPLGLSMLWVRQSTIQDFIHEVLDHIQGALFIDPQTGLLTLKLIRGDYDVNTLPTIDPGTANLSNFGRKLWGEIANEITVTWTNPENEQDETVTAQDLASIVTQGGIVSDSRNYYGVRYAALAKRLAERDLRSAGAPLATCDAEVDRSFWYLRPASVLLVDWPEYGLSGVVMRITSIDYGKPGDPSIKLSLIEDVFGLDTGDYVDPPASAWEDPSQPPTAMTYQEALTLPYFFAANGTTDITGAAYPEVLAGVLGASANVDAFSFELWGEVAQPDGSTQWESLATLSVVGRAQLAANIAAEATSTGVTFNNYTGTARPSVNGFALIRAGDETQNEIAFITSATSPYSLSRGMLDTTPKAWAAGTTVWFVESDSLFEDPTARSVGEVVNWQLRTITSRGILAAAPWLTYTMIDRPWRPSRPANVAIGGVKFTSGTPIAQFGVDPIVVSWANRNRLTEDSTVLKWTDPTVTPETGQTTTIKLYKADGTTLLATHSGLTGTSFNLPASDFGTESAGYVEVSATRTDADGTFVSLQAHRLYVQIAYVSAPVGMASETDTAIGLASSSGSGIRSDETDTALKLTGLSGNYRATSGDMQSGSDRRVLAGDEAGNTRVTREIF